MKKKLTNTLIFCFGVLLLLASSCGNNNNANKHDDHEHKAGEIYTCPMHPEIESDKPGVCPKCNMNLELKKDSTAMLFEPNNAVYSRQATVKLQSVANLSSKVYGQLQINPDRNITVSAFYGGRIEKLYVNYENKFVKQGDPVLEIYSPEMSSFQEEHLLLLKSGNQKLINKSKEKLKLLGLTQVQILNLEKSGVVKNTVTIYSPESGYVFFDKQTSISKTLDEEIVNMSGMQMGNQLTTAPQPTETTIEIKQGSYVKEGQQLFTINNLADLWAVLSVPYNVALSFKENENINVFVEGSTQETILGKVVLTEKTFNNKEQNFLNVRLLVNNGNQALKINSNITATVSNSSVDKLLPNSAIYFTGLHAYVWLKQENNLFKLNKVVTGKTSSGFTQVVSGLSNADEVAKDAGLMVDSETFLFMLN